MTVPSITKHDTVKQNLISAISSGKLGSGQKLPGENRLATQYGVSTGTLRQVLDEMAREGLLMRVKGSGTYVSDKKEEKKYVNIPIGDPQKILLKHLWGKILERAHKGTQVVIPRQMSHQFPSPGLETQKMVVRMFTSSEAAGLFEVSMSDLDHLVDMGLCEDLTSKYENWSQRDNLFSIAIDAVKYNKRVYGLPFHSTLISFAYHKSSLEKEKIDPAKVTTSLDEFTRTVEALSQKSQYQHTFWVNHLRPFMMHLLYAFYGDMIGRFSGADARRPIEREIGLEILQILHRLKWRYRTIFPSATEYSSNYTSQGINNFVLGRIPMSCCQLLPRWSGSLNEYSENINVEFLPFEFNPHRRGVALFNCYVWIINPLVDRTIREFLWNFLQEYVHPQSEYELDRRHMEEGQINQRTNSFIQVPPRVPDNPEYDRQRRDLFTYAERELPFPTPAFDWFLVAGNRMLMDPEANVEQEYQFYLSMCETEIV